MRPSPTYQLPEGEECETSAEHGLPLWAELAVGYCSPQPRPSPMWGGRFVGARAVGPWVGEQKPLGKTPQRGNPSPESTYLPSSMFALLHCAFTMTRDKQCACCIRSKQDLYVYTLFFEFILSFFDSFFLIAPRSKPGVCTLIMYSMSRHRAVGGTGRPLGKTFFLHRQRRHPELPKIPTYLPTYLPLCLVIFLLLGDILL